MNEMLVQYGITLSIAFASTHLYTRRSCAKTGYFSLDKLLSKGYVLTKQTTLSHLSSGQCYPPFNNPGHGGERHWKKTVLPKNTTECPQQVARAYYCEAIAPPSNPEYLMLIIRLSVISCTTVYWTTCLLNSVKPSSGQCQTCAIMVPLQEWYSILRDQCKGGHQCWTSISDHCQKCPRPGNGGGVIQRFPWPNKTLWGQQTKIEWLCLLNRIQ